MWPVRQDFEKFVNEYAEKQQEAIDAFRSAPWIILDLRAEPGICRSLSEVRCGREPNNSIRGVGNLLAYSDIFTSGIDYI
jgi:hypothetical protein